MGLFKKKVVEQNVFEAPIKETKITSKGVESGEKPPEPPNPPTPQPTPLTYEDIISLKATLDRDILITVLQTQERLAALEKIAKE